MLQSTVSMDMPCGSVELCIHINRDILTDFWTTSTSLVYLQAFLERKNTMKVENQKTRLFSHFDVQIFKFCFKIDMIAQSAL